MSVGRRWLVESQIVELALSWTWLIRQIKIDSFHNSNHDELTFECFAVEPDVRWQLAASFSWFDRREHGTHSDDRASNDKSIGSSVGCRLGNRGCCWKSSVDKSSYAQRLVSSLDIRQRCMLLLLCSWEREWGKSNNGWWPLLVNWCISRAAHGGWHSSSFSKSSFVSHRDLSWNRPMITRINHSLVWSSRSALRTKKSSWLPPDSN